MNEILNRAIASLWMPMLLTAAPASYVYTMSNAVSGNQILAYTRAVDGTLIYKTAVPTGGLGTGYNLGTEGSLATIGKYIFAVNAGSNTISVLSGAGTLSVVSTVDSGGPKPVSLTYFEGTLYVLNGGIPNSITGFAFDSTSGILTPIPNSTQALSGASVGPAEVAFNKAGTVLVVTEKDTNLIDIFPVTGGVAGPLSSYASHGKTPDGFAFGRDGQFFVAEAWSGTNKLSGSVSSYQLDAFDVPVMISGSHPAGQPGTCCLAVTPNGSFVYASDLNTAFFTSFAVNGNGQLADAGSYILTASGAHLADIAVSADGLNLYVLDHQLGNVFAYTIGADGTVTKINGGSFAPNSASGLIVR